MAGNLRQACSTGYGMIRYTVHDKWKTGLIVKLQEKVDLKK